MYRCVLLSLLIIVFWCGIFNASYSQSPSIDSLKEVAKGNADLSERIKAYRALAHYTYDENPDLSVSYRQKAMELAKQNKQEDYIDAVFKLSSTYRHIGRFENAFSLLDSFKTEVADSLVIAKVYYKLGRVYEATGDPNNAIQSYDTAYHIYKRHGDLEEAAIMQSQIGREHYSLGDYKSAMEHYEIARQIFEKNNIRTHEYGTLLHFIGSVYKREHKSEIALKYYEQQLALGKELGDQETVADALYLCAGRYGSLGDKEKELEYSLEALKMFKEMNDVRSIALMYGNLSGMYSERGDEKTSLEYLEEAYKMYRELGVKNKLAWIMSKLGRAYSKNGEHNKGIAIIKASIDLAKQSNRKKVLRLKENTYDLAFAYYRKGDFQNAFDTYLDYEVYKDSLENQQNEYFLQDLEAKYETEKKEQELSMKDQAIEMQNALIEQKSRQNVYAAVAVVIAVLVMIYIARLNRERRKANALLADQNAQLERLSLVASKTENSVIILDPNGNLEWVNRAFRTLSGIEDDGMDELVGKPVTNLNGFTEFASTFDVCRNEKKSVQYESSMVTGSGESKWHSSTITPILTESGDINKFIIIDTDITTQKVSEQIIQQKNIEITDSINYARKIQEAILTSEDFWQKSFAEHFVLYKPRDIVSGDFYWAYETHDGKKIWAVADCTGHGVPGAFMSMVGNSLLNEIVIENKIEQPDLILNQLRKQLIRTLRQDEDGAKSQDGMDMAICCLDHGKLSYSGANNPLFLMREGKLNVFPPDKQPVGQYYGDLQPFTNQEIDIEKDDLVYLFTDGYVDQFGGNNNKKFLKRRFVNLIETVCTEPLKKQREILDQTIEEWRGEFEQVDDICVVGVKV